MVELLHSSNLEGKVQLFNPNCLYIGYAIFKLLHQNWLSNWVMQVWVWEKNTYPAFWIGERVQVQVKWWKSLRITQNLTQLNFWMCLVCLNSNWLVGMTKQSDQWVDWHKKDWSTWCWPWEDKCKCEVSTILDLELLAYKMKQFTMWTISS